MVEYFQVFGHVGFFLACQNNVDYQQYKTMPTKQPEPQPALPVAAEQPKRDSQQLTAEIGKHVLRTLGRPGGQHRVLVRPLWTDHYRVNVFIGDSGSAKIAHSYFLVADGDGKVVKSTPRITKQY